MNRDGLVQRKAAAQSSLAGGATEYDGEQEDDCKYKPDDEEDKDCKEMRLTLMEEILLLGLKDKEARIPSQSDSF